MTQVIIWRHFYAMLHYTAKSLQRQYENPFCLKNEAISALDFYVTLVTLLDMRNSRQHFHSINHIGLKLRFLSKNTTRGYCWFHTGRRGEEKMRTLCTLSIVYLGALPLYLHQSPPVLQPFPRAVGHLMPFLLAEHDVKWKETIIQVSDHVPYSCLGHYDGKKES